MAEINSTGMNFNDATGVLTIVAPDGLKVGGNKVPQNEPIQSSPLSSASASQTLFLADNAYQITAVAVVFGTASSSGTMQIEVATGTTAVGSGTSQLSGTMSLSGTANTVVNGALIASPTNIAAGNRINIILAGTLTSLANCVVTVTLKRI